MTPAALITGAYSGFGRAAALRWGSEGWTAFAGVRRPIQISTGSAGNERIQMTNTTAAKPFRSSTEEVTEVFPLARAIAIAVGFCLLFVLAPGAMASGVRVLGPKAISRDTPLPAGCDGLSQETDTMIAADPHNPRHLVATWDQDDHKSNVTATSRNGGKTWKISTIPGISKCNGGV